MKRADKTKNGQNSRKMMMMSILSDDININMILIIYYDINILIENKSVHGIMNIAFVWQLDSLQAGCQAVKRMRGAIGCGRSVKFSHL
jgi:hypothetical protein